MRISNVFKFVSVFLVLGVYHLGHTQSLTQIESISMEFKLLDIQIYNMKYTLESRSGGGSETRMSGNKDYEILCYTDYCRLTRKVDLNDDSLGIYGQFAGTLDLTKADIERLADEMNDSIVAIDSLNLIDYPDGIYAKCSYTLMRFDLRRICKITVPLN